MEGGLPDKADLEGHFVDSLSCLGASNIPSIDCMSYPSVLSFTSAQQDGLIFHLFLVVMLGPAMGWRHGNKNKKG